MDNREEALVAQVCRPARTWSLVLEVDGMPIAFDAMLRHYRGRHVGLVAEALEQPLLLPRIWWPTGALTIRNSSFP